MLHSYFISSMQYYSFNTSTSLAIHLMRNIDLAKKFKLRNEVGHTIQDANTRLSTDHDIHWDSFEFLLLASCTYYELPSPSLSSKSYTTLLESRSIPKLCSTVGQAINCFLSLVGQRSICNLCGLYAVLQCYFEGLFVLPSANNGSCVTRIPLNTRISSVDSL